MTAREASIGAVAVAVAFAAGLAVPRLFHGAEPPRPTVTLGAPRPRFQTDYRDGRVIARRRIDPITGTVTALPIDEEAATQQKETKP